MAEPSSGGIFLSYRRQDTAPYARALQLQLSQRFPNARVFMDLDSIEPGLDFAQVITEAVDSAAVMVALIGSQWVTITDDEGNQRIKNPHDYVRFEIHTALERGLRVIPVLIEGAKPLQPRQLPTGLRKLARLNALELSNSRYQYDAGRLLDLIEQVLAAAPRPGENPPGAPLQDAPGPVRSGQANAAPIPDSVGMGAMTSPESSGSDCWPDDEDYLDGRTQMFWPSQDSEEVGGYWDTTLLDLAGHSLRGQINVGEPFQIRFRAEVQPGEFWVGASGNWTFDLAFSPIGRGSGFNLSDLLPSPSVLKVGGWRGEDTRCIEIAATVPPNLLPGSGGLYEVVATIAFQPTGGKIEPFSGTEPMDSYSLQPQGGQRDQAD